MTAERASSSSSSDVATDGEDDRRSHVGTTKKRPVEA
jgi:hypothetical protein